jgi:hypothetical protein
MTYPSSVSSDDLQRFSQVATIHNEKGFLIALEQLLAERTANSAACNLPPDVVARALAMEAPFPYRPTTVQLLRGRMQQLAEPDVKLICRSHATRPSRTSPASSCTRRFPHTSCWPYPSGDVSYVCPTDS